MTVTDRPTLTPDGVLAAARALAPTISARAAGIEAARRVPTDLFDQLSSAGCLGISRPASHGGIGADLTSALRVHEHLARADASVAWVTVIAGSSWFDLAGLPRPSFDALFADRAEPRFAGAFNPSGSITAVDGGYRVTGRWSFVSGCEDADWIFGNCVEHIGDGVPSLRMAVFPRREVTIEDSWHVSGLRGTGSHHVHVEDVRVPADRTLRPLADRPCLDDPVVRIPTPGLFALHIATVAVGVALGALDDVVALAGGKVPLLAGRALATDPLFQQELGDADTAVRAARALLRQVSERTWEAAQSGTPFSWEQRADMRAAAAWATATAAHVTATAYRAGGGSSLYDDCPLQRRLRDVDAITQHFLVKRGTMATVGAILAGQEVAVPVF